MTTLTNKTISGIIWSLLQGVGGRGISFLLTIILARLLTPEIFGLIGMLAIFLQVSQTLIMAGFNEALIQKKDTDEEDYSSVFWLNLFISVAIYLILFVSAPLITKFYNQPLLTQLTRVLSLAFIINAFSYVQEARLRKDMKFKTLTIIHLPAIVLAGIVSITMAFNGCGVWSLVAMELITRLAYAIQIWIYSKWKPLIIFRKSNVKQMFSFGSKLMISGILNTIYKNIYLVLIGKFFPLSSVGYYQTANKLVDTPSTTLSNALSSVIFPAFSTIQDDNQRLKDGYKKIIRQLLFWMCPAFILAAVLADPLFRFIYTEKWLPAVPFFQLLCVSGILYPLNAYNLSIVNIKGRSDLFLRLEIIKKVFTTTGIIVTIPFGIWALLSFQAINTIFAYFLNSFYSGRFIQYNSAEQIKDTIPYLILSLVIGAVVFTIDQFLNEYPDLIRLILGFGLGIMLYGLAARILKLPAYLDVQKLLQMRLANNYIK